MDQSKRDSRFSYSQSHQSHGGDRRNSNSKPNTPHSHFSHTQMSFPNSASMSRSLNAPIPRQQHRGGTNASLSSGGSLNLKVPISRKSKPEAVVPLNLNAPIGRKPKSTPVGPISNLNPSGQGHVTIKSEKPFIIRVKMTGISLISHSAATTTASKRNGNNLSLRSSGRSKKRKSYAEALQDTDSDDLLTDSDDDQTPQQTSSKRIKKVKEVNTPAVPTLSSSSNHSPNVTEQSHIDPTTVNSATTTATATSTTIATVATSFLPFDPSQVEAPPPGVLSSLWYSRECVINIWVIEKIIGWKTRPKLKLSYNPDQVPLEKMDANQRVGWLTVTKGTALGEKMVTETISHPRKRMEVSRINPSGCPVVLRAASSTEEKRAKKLATDPEFVLSPSNSENEQEEVLLIKWRGRSYLHCSWERKRDLERFDASNNTVRGKVKRYYQSQEALLGRNWKKIVGDGRNRIGGHLHSHGLTKDDSEDIAPGEEDFFAPDYVEVERILACDENEMDMNVLARQRALNLKAEREAVKKREAEILVADLNGKTTGGSPAKEIVPSSSDDAKSSCTSAPNNEEEEPWDPEDNVRYVVKWKGLQVSEITWEYWRHIKYDSVDQAEDFWNRQKAPDLEEAKIISGKAHPHMREYKKLVTSPTFGTSSTKRPVADLLDDKSSSENVEDEEDSAESAVALRLRAYQLEGVNWLLWNWWNKRSCILADEMGLGKTIQSMCFLDQLHRLSPTQVRGPFLIVAPLSLVNQWQSESTTWAPDFNVLLYHGSMDARDFLVKQEFYYSDQFVAKTTAVKLKRMHITKFHILITTYEVAMKDIAVLSKIKWKALIVDEAHRLKNHQSRLFSELASVPRDFCLLLTGTPLQNSTEELWSLLNFSDPVLFGSKEEFVDKFGQLTDSHQVSELHSLLKPYLLRRVKEDVEKSLPPKEETILEVTLTPIQKTYYKAIYEKNTSFLFKGAKPSNAPSLMNIMMELRKCCNHPFLIKGAEERIMAEADAKKDENFPDDPVLRWHKLLADQLVKSSGKMVILMKLLPKLQSGGHKVLIFSQMVRVLDLLEELLRLKQYRYERLDGSTGASARAAAVDRFNRKSFHRFVMLLSTRAGGLGLNLTSADTVIIFDSDWNPQNDLQAMARAHRIGQTRAVRVYRLLTSKTYEMHMFHSASMKLGLDRAVLAHQRQQGGDEDQDSGKKTNKSKSEKEMQAKEIDELLKKGAYDVFRDEDDAEAKKFMETDIDQLLERSSRTVTYGNTNTSMSSGLGSFSKASFVTADADGKDVDLDDPDFWEKAVGLDAPVESNIDENLLLDGEKRSRKQVQVFDPYAAFHEAEQKKKDKIAQKVKQEKEEKERLKLKKKKKRAEEKERRRKEKEGFRDSKDKSKGSSSMKDKSNDHEILIRDKKISKDAKLKKLRRLERRRTIRIIMREDPIQDRIKQGWESNQRDRAINATLLYGFGRFCKIRNGANLTSLPIQDIEVFIRGYIYQLGLQASISLLSEYSDSTKMTNSIKNIFSTFGDIDGEWIANSIYSSMKLYAETQRRRSILRLSQTLLDPIFTSQLRSGGAIIALRRLAFLSRLNRVIGISLSQVLADLGHEELGKRGCHTKDLSTLDIDLKARHVTTEELSHAIGCHLGESWKDKILLAWCPAPWWDRACDLALIIGSFVHGLSNYEAMQQDDDLPFSSKMYEYGKRNFECISSCINFLSITKCVRRVFDDAMSNLRNKNHPDVSGQNLNKSQEENVVPAKGAPSTFSDAGANQLPSDNDGVTKITVRQNSHTVTLIDLTRAIDVEIEKLGDQTGNQASNHPSTNSKLPMPASKVLDRRLIELLDLIETNHVTKTPSGHIDAPFTKTCVGPTNEKGEGIHEIFEESKIAAKGLMQALGEPVESVVSSKDSFYSRRYEPNFCDESSCGIGLVSSSITGPAVPSLLSHFGIAALLYAETKTLRIVVEIEDKIKITSSESVVDTSHQDKPNSEENTIPSETSDNIAISNGFLSSRSKSPIYLYNLHTIAEDLQHSKRRAGICAAVLFCGWPLADENSISKNLDDDLKSICYPSSLTNSCDLFNATNLLEIATFISGTNYEINTDNIHSYVNNVLLPHCVRLCLSSNNVFAVEDGHLKSSGNEKFEGDNVIKDLCKEGNPLPDPFLRLESHSSNAVRYASALLRRMKLTFTIRTIVGGAIPVEKLVSFLQSSKVRNITDGIPLWWCPWIHDLALLAHAARFGLFAILNDYKDTEKMKELGCVFESKRIKDHIRKILFEGANGHRPLLPRKLRSKASSSQLKAFVESHMNQFPSAFVIERRLGFICESLSRKYAHLIKNKENVSCRYLDIPMFDHGG